MKMYWQFKIKAIAEKAAADNKRINGAMIKRQYNIPYSVTLFFIYIKMNLNCLLLNLPDTISFHINALMDAHNSRRASTSSPSVGSSRNKICGSEISAIAIERRRCIPPDKRVAFLFNSCSNLNF